jgi:hypothetical protein
MNGRGPYNDNVSFDAEESSGVTSLAPVPAKPTRLSGLDENDRTQFFSVGALLDRGKAEAAREQVRVAREQVRAVMAAAAAASAVPHASHEPRKPARAGILRQIREASFARKASALLLPLLIVLLSFKPVFKKPKQGAVRAPLAVVVTSPQPDAPPQLKLATTPAAPPPTLPRGVSLEKAAADAVAAGDFMRAVALYRELSRREPARAAYTDALAILERRVRAKAP